VGALGDEGVFRGSVPVATPSQEEP
jgi:hypothetical protein